MEKILNLRRKFKKPSVNAESKIYSTILYNDSEISLSFQIGSEYESKKIYPRSLHKRIGAISCAVVLWRPSWHRVPAKTFEFEHLSRDVSHLKRTRSIPNICNRATFYILISTLQNNVFLFTVYQFYIMIYLISIPISAGEIK